MIFFTCISSSDLHGSQWNIFYYPFLKLRSLAPCKVKAPNLIFFIYHISTHEPQEQRSRNIHVQFASVLVRAAVIEYHRPGALTTDFLYFWHRAAHDQGPGRFGVWWQPASWLTWPSSLSALTWWEGVKALCGALFIRSLTPFMGVPSSWHSHVPRPRLRPPSHWGWDCQHVNLGRTKTFVP